MIDIHTHLLPAVDDGAADLETAVEMCRLALADGCETLIATPHQRQASWWNDDPADLAERRFRLQARVGERPRLLLGAEVRADAELVAALGRPDRSGILGLAGSRYLLVELSRSGAGPDPEGLVHELAVAGWRPIIAHPEFVPRIAGDPSWARRLVSRGALLQITAMSLTGEFGDRVRRVTSALLDLDLVHFVASDAHDPEWRRPGLARAFREVESHWGAGRAAALFQDHPLCVVEDRPLAGHDDLRSVPLHGSH